MTYCSIRIALKYIKTRRGFREKNSTGTLFFFSLQWCFSWSFPFICRCAGQKSTLLSLSKQSICPETDQNGEGSVQVLTKPKSLRHFLWTSIQKHHSQLDKSQTVPSVLDYFRWLVCRALDSHNNHRATVAGNIQCETQMFIPHNRVIRILHAQFMYSVYAAWLHPYAMVYSELMNTE